MPKINIYLSEDLAGLVREANLPVSAICQTALERAVRDVTSARGTDAVPKNEPAHWVGVFNRFTARARQAVLAADRLARDVPHNYVATEHLLLGILEDGESLGTKVLAALEVEPEDLRAELLASMGPATPKPVPNTLVPFTPRAKLALEHAAKEALGMGHNYIGCEHLMLGLIATEDSLAGKVLRRMGLELRNTRRAVVAALSGFVHTQRDQPAAGSEQMMLDEIVRRLDAIEQRLAG